MDAPKDLDWIHDCILSRVEYDPNRDSGRLIKFEIFCPADFGYPPWQGKNLLLNMQNIVTASGFIWGWVNGPEIINAIRPGVSDEVRGRASNIASGVDRAGKLELTVMFQSGSFFEIICETIQIEVVS